MVSMPTALENPAMTIGEILKRYRLKMGETLEEVAHRAGTDPSNLSRVERGMQQPSVALLEALAKSLDTRVSDLYREYEEAASANRVGEPAPAGWETDMGKLQRHFRALDEKNRQLLIDFCRLLEKSQ